MGGNNNKKMLQTLEKISTFLTTAKTIPDLKETIVKIIDSLVEVEYSALYLYDQKEETLKLFFAKGFSEEECVEAERTAMQRHPGQVFLQQQLLHETDVRDATSKAFINNRSFVVRSRLYLPVIYHEKCIGCLGLAALQPHVFSERHIEVLRFVGNMAGMLHHNIQYQAKLEQQKKRITHVHKVLSAIRHINQLITHERNPDRLLNKACRFLMDTRGFHNAWIVQVKNTVPENSYYFSGSTSDFTHMAEQLRSKKLPDCLMSAMKNEGISKSDLAHQLCFKCPLLLNNKDVSCLHLRLSTDNRMFGWLTVSVPVEYSSDRMEHELLEEIAGTLAFALHSIEKDESLHESEELIGDITKFNWIWEVDPQGDFTYCSEKVKDLLEWLINNSLIKCWPIC